jgi:hypothetical protein
MVYLNNYKLFEFKKSLQQFGMPAPTGPWGGYVDDEEAFIARLETTEDPAEVAQQLRSQLNTD